MGARRQHKQLPLAFKLSMLPGDRINKLDPFGQQLQGLSVVDLPRRGERGVEAIVQNRQTERRHVNAQVVALAGDGLELVARQLALHFEQGDVGDGVGRTAHLVLQHEVSGLDDPAGAGQRQFQVFAPGGNRLVSLKDGVLTEQGTADSAIKKWAKAKIIENDMGS